MSAHDVLESRALRRTRGARGAFVLVAAFVLGGLAHEAAAHHSAAAFDPDARIEVTGTVSKVEWLSPHARLYVDVSDEAGATVTWDFELPSPNTLMRRGWSRSSLAIGDTVSVRGIRARNGAAIAIAQGVTDASGKRLFATTAGP